ncbi:hypothetical protein A0J48_004390 [Sphaerospermopsis aphanizomenoides BCCUSP55]|uniref:hypothetical protein n=1 Tax=Sphaerospermopsis aphanizomenoides TaxID=459663 RepID=UPI001906F9B9|nr:hypothetical protein [Sphaerospermopsis aphanizomenoides]MBK1986788.1 hypothetical protein [Sphaerospermopsis aphanizomenoides BCCUSP55]
MNEHQKTKCHQIIHGAALSGAGLAAGMAQVPGADVPLLMGIEITMTISLGSVFGISLTESAAKSIVLAQIATIAGRGVSQALVGWIPLFGNAINAGTAAGVIEAMGWAIANDFANQSNRDRE